MEISSAQGNFEAAKAALFAADTPTDTQHLAQEMSAMEAVRELLFGRRMGELQGRIKKAEEGMGETVRNLDETLCKRIGEVDELLKSEAKRIDAAVEEHKAEWSKALEGHKAENATRFLDQEAENANVKKQLSDLDKKLQGDVSALREEIRALQRSISGELAAMRASTPTVAGLAQMFRQMAERMKETVSSEELESAVARNGKNAAELAALSA